MRTPLRLLATSIVVGALGVASGTAGDDYETLDPVEISTDVVGLGAPPEPFENLPEPMRSALLEPEAVTISLTEPQLHINYKEDDPRSSLPRVGDWLIRTATIQIDSVPARQVSGLILHEEHVNPGMKMCLFSPDVCYSFTRDDTSVSAVVCHGCSMVQLPEGNLKEMRHLDRVNFDLLDIARRLFPDDEPLQRVADRRHRAASQ